MKKAVLSKSYYETPNPYVNAPSCHVNLLELSKYAREKGKKLADLSKEEVNQFFIDLETLFSNEDFTKAQVVEAIKKFIPNFEHEETGKNLDQKM